MTNAEFEEIYNRYFSIVHKYLLGLSKNEHLAEEMTSETFFKAMNAIEQFDGRCEITTWLCQIAKNSYYTYLQKNKKMELSDTIPEQMECRARTIEELMVDQDAVMRIHGILHKIKEPYKEVFMLRVFGELSFHQIGAIFQKTENWACVTYHRARMQIEKEMGEY
ncbi:RNA polymerase sigma factor [Anaerosporobacter faecicola]|uniref:RNA polymerase sigma factor n=1 Tax=Anaerosporobacter faecicola TaxID=2718714 RepID=UPI00143B424B|nr:sigma-70 family RNA polymerase sigma factor [Anaerosporobacter faecicola]